MSTLVLDNFTDTNNTALSAHAISPTNTPSTSWSDVDGTWVVDNNNHAYCGSLASGHGTEILDSGVADCTIIGKVTCVGATKEAGLTFRQQDSSNMWKLSGYAGDGKFYLYKVTAGTYSSPTNGAAGVANGVEFEMKIVLSGSSMTFYKDGVQKLTYSDSSFVTATKHGLASWQVANTVDDFEVDGTAATAKLFRQSPLDGIGGGGPFFANPLAA